MIQAIVFCGRMGKNKYKLLAFLLNIRGERIVL